MKKAAPSDDSSVTLENTFWSSSAHRWQKMRKGPGERAPTPTTPRLKNEGNLGVDDPEKRTIKNNFDIFSTTKKQPKIDQQLKKHQT